MKHVSLLLIFLLFNSNLTQAQKEYPLTQAIKEFKTPEQVLGLSSAFSVIQCHVLVVTPKNGTLLRCYSKNGLNCCCIPNCSDFSATWEPMSSHLRKGDKLILDNIVVRKGDKDFKWVEKVFVEP